MEGLAKRHVIIAVDESDASKKVFEWTMENFYRDGDMLHIFHVIPPGQYVVLSSDLGVQDVIQDDDATLKAAEDHARDYLTKTFALRLETEKVPYQLEIVRFSTDSDSIGSITCKRAEQVNANAVIMAKHNKGAVKEFFMGSVCTYMSHNCKIPLVILHVD